MICNADTNKDKSMGFGLEQFSFLFWGRRGGIAFNIAFRERRALWIEPMMMSFMDGAFTEATVLLSTLAYFIMFIFLPADYFFTC